MNLGEPVNNLLELRARHLKVAGATFVQELYPLDFLALAVLNRSLCLVSAFAMLIEARNLIAAAPLIRLQLDNALRFFASTLVDQPHEFAMKVLGGARIDRIKDKSGNRLTDKHLVTTLGVHEAWIESVYEQTSGFVHLSEKHIFNAVKIKDKKERDILMKISDRDEFAPETAYQEALDVFTRVTELVLNVTEAWATRRLKLMVTSSANLRFNPDRDRADAPLLSLQSVASILGAHGGRQEAGRQTDGAGIPRNELERIEREFLDHQYRRTLAEPVPTLGNVAPRSAVETAAGTQRVVEWLKYLENCEERRARDTGAGRAISPGRGATSA